MEYVRVTLTIIIVTIIIITGAYAFYESRKNEWEADRIWAVIGIFLFVSFGLLIHIARDKIHKVIADTEAKTKAKTKAETKAKPVAETVAKTKSVRATNDADVDESKHYGKIFVFMCLVVMMGIIVITIVTSS